MNNILEYKGYHAKVSFDAEEEILFGKIEGIRDLVTFEADEMKNVKKEFENAVDDYLESCVELGKKPDKEYRGTFNVRISPELHKEMALLALKNGEYLNQTVEKAIQNYVDGIYQAEIKLCDSIIRLSQVLEGGSFHSNSSSKDLIKVNSNFSYDVAWSTSKAMSCH